RTSRRWSLTHYNTNFASPWTTTTRTSMAIPTSGWTTRSAGFVCSRPPRTPAMTRSGIGPTLEALPVPSSQLDRYRLRLRQRDRGTVTGAHLIRQRGQSLDFREFRPYLPGDDVRHVDWRASARHHRRDELVVRTFEHEVQTRLVISIDTRPTMRLPDVASKLQLARWFAEAMSYIAARSGDSVAFHALESGRVIEIGSSADRWRIRHALERVSAQSERPATAGAWTALERALPPGSVWL